MKTQKLIDNLWYQFCDAIDKAYKVSQSSEYNENDARNLGDYVGYGRDLRNLVNAETNNERQHRRGFRHDWAGKAPISSEAAAKLLLMNNANDGANKTEMIPASLFLIIRKTAAEAMVIGWLVREHLSAEWKKQVSSLDYAKIMRAEQ